MEQNRKKWSNFSINRMFFYLVPILTLVFHIWFFGLNIHGLNHLGLTIMLVSSLLIAGVYMFGNVKRVLRFVKDRRRTITKKEEKTKSRTLAAFLFILSTFFPASSYAINLSHMEFYTYGGFSVVSSAFQRTALIFGDDNFRTLFFGLIVIAIVFGAISTYYRILTGGRGGSLGWAWPILLGVIVFLTLIIPRGSLTIYDPVLNRFQTIGNLPVGIVALAGITNRIERGFVEMVKTSGDPMSYELSAGGLGLDVLMHTVRMGIRFTGPEGVYMDKSILSYIDRCVWFAIGAGHVDIDAIKRNNTDLMPLFAEAANPANFSVWYSRENKRGETMTCQEAWTRISNEIRNPANFQKMAEAACANAGINVRNPNERRRCIELIEGHVLRFITDPGTGQTFGQSVTATGYLRQVYLAQRLEEVAQNAGTVTAGSFDYGIRGMSTGMMMNQWIPAIKAVLTAVVVSVTPFFVIFIVTPLIGRALSLIAGFFIWLTAFGIMDAVIHQAAVDQGIRVFESVRQNMLGYDAIMMLPGAAEKSLAMFGYVRSFGMMLATIATGILVKFGGHALAMMSGSLSGSISTTATSAGQQTQTPGGSAGMIDEQTSAKATHALASKFSFEERWMSRALEGGRGIRAASGEIRRSGGLNNTIESLGHADEMKNRTHSEWGAGITPEIATQTGRHDAETQARRVEIDQKIADNYHNGNVGEYRLWEQKGKHLTGDIARKKERSMGLPEGSLENTRLENPTFSSDGRLMSGTFVRQDRSGSIDIRDGLAITRGVNEDGSSFVKKQDINTGNLVSYLSHKTLAEDKIITDTGGRQMTVRAGSEMIETRGGDGSAITTYKGIFADSSGKIWAGEAILQNGQLTRLDAGSGESLREESFQTSKKAVSIGDLGRMRDMFAEGGYLSAAKNIDRTIQSMKEDGRTQAVVNIAQKPGSNPGEFATMIIDAGIESGVVNFNLSKRGYEDITKALNVNEWGSRKTGGDKRDVTNTNFTGNRATHYDVNTTEIDRGTKIGDTALQMAIRGDRALFSEVVDAFQSNDLVRTSAEVSATSSRIVAGLESYVEQSGKNAHKAIGQAYIELGKGTPSFSPVKASMGAEGRVAIESNKATTINLMTKALDDIQISALKEGERLGYSDRQLESHVAAKTAQFVNTWKDFATSDQEFGAEKPGDLMNKAAGKVYSPVAPLSQQEMDKLDKNRL